MPADLNDRGDGADVQFLVLNFDDLKGQQQNKGDLDDLIGLDIHGKPGNDPGDDQPIQVAGVVVLPQGGEEEKDKDHVKEQQQFPPLSYKELEVHKGEQHIGHHSEQDGNKLDKHEAHPAAVAGVLGSGIDESQPKSAGGQTQA